MECTTSSRIRRDGSSMETGLSIVQVVVVLAAMLGFAGCEGEESVRLSDEIRSVANIEKKWERGCLRWRKAKCRYRADVDTTAMIRAAHDFADTEWMHADSAVPLLLKFSRDRSIKAEKTHERLVDLRGNPDGQYCITALIFGTRAGIMSNSLCFCFPDAGRVAVWSRRFDRMDSWSRSSPFQLQAGRISDIPFDDLGVFSASWSGLRPVFLGMDGFALEDFLRGVEERGLKLYWCQGKMGGVGEGMHLCDARAFEDFILGTECIIPLELVFAADDTYIFSMRDKASFPNWTRGPTPQFQKAGAKAK